MEIGRLVAVFEADITKFEAGRKQVESGMQKTAQSVNQSQKKIADGELTMAQRLKAAESLQRQRSAALIAQWKQQERAARAAASGHKTFSQSLSDLSTSVAALQGPLGGISGRLSSLSSLFAGVTGPAGAAVLAIGAVATAAIAAGTAIYKLAASTAEATGKFKDLSQQTGFSVETLSTLANLAETSGGNIDTVSAALSIFESNMIEAQDPTTEMSRLFKQLGIDTTNNEKALRQLIDVLDKETNAENRSAIARKLAGRSARELLGIVGDMKGTFDENTESMRGVNLVTTEMADKGDELADAIRRMSQVFGHATNVIGQEFGPDVKKAVEIVTKAIIDNKDVIRDWATAFADAARGALIVADAVKTLGGAITGLGNLPIPTILKMLGSISGATGILSGLQNLGASPTGGTPFTRNRPAFRTPNFSAFRPDALGRPPRGGGGGGGGGRDPVADARRIADLTLRILQESLKSEETSIERSYDQRQLIIASFQRAMMRLEQVRHEAVIETLDNEERLIEKIKKPHERKVALIELELKRLQEANRHREAEYKLEDKILGVTRQRFALTDRMATRARITSLDVLGAAGATRERTVGLGAEGATRPRIATVEEQILREQYQMHIERMRDLAIKLTGILDRAIFDGFEGGIKRGFQSLTLGILDLVKNVFLKQLENALANALSSAGGGGGGLLSGLFSALLGSVVGGLGGGFTKGGFGAGVGGKAYASGGTIPMGSWGVVHDNERVFATPFGAKVVPSGQGSSSPTIIINVPVRSAGAYSSPKSRRQLAEDISAALQGSLA